MQSPPKAFNTPRRNKRHKSNNYNPYLQHDYTTTNNPDINYLSPPRKHKKRNNYYTAPQPHRINSNITSSPISTRYTTRINGIGTSLYDGEHSNISPLRSDKRKRIKYLSSPISPTFEPIGHSPNRHRNKNGYNSHKIDRYTPAKGNINQYEFHSPTKRFLHNNKNMLNSTNIIRPSPSKKRKLTQNYSGTNDDPNSLNHKLKQKLSQHTYNMVLQSELLGQNQKYHLHGITNEAHCLENDNISSIQNEPNDEDEKENNSNIQQNIYSSPSLPNRRIRNQSTPNRDGNNRNICSSHHPLCPCYNISNDDNSINDSEDSEQLSNQSNNNNNNNFECVCDSITANVASDFLVSPQRTLRYNINDNNNEENNENDYNLNMTPIKQSSQSQLNCSRKSMRNIAKSPFKVLDAPRLTDDFYLNLVDWSQCSNILSVGLGECVYLWSAYTSKVTKLVDLTVLFNENPPSDNFEEYSDGYDMVCSVGWNKNISIQNTDVAKNNNNISNNYLAVGSGNGYVFIFDTNKSKLCRSPLNKHNHRVGVISWKNKNILATGSRDRNIFLRDIRINDNQTDITKKLSFHKQEVCGLKWSHDSLYLASGGNDNKLSIWDLRYINNNKPLCYGKHKAAVKAITWSPHESGLIASGGGTADRCIKFWNINSFVASSQSHNNNNKHIQILKPSEVIDTGSQVCNLLWSKNVNEIVSTHGYSLNQIVVWKYPSMDKIVTLTGHTYRVLYLAGSPDGQTIVTGAGDETLRLWNIFPPLSNNGNDINTFVPQPYSIPLHIR
eukprot:320263_1